MWKIKDISRLYSISDVLNIGRRARKIVCPLPQHRHTNNSPSFSIYRNAVGDEYWKCHGNCGLEGDVVDLVGYTSIPGYDPSDGKQVIIAMSILQQKNTINPPKPVKPTPTIAPDAWMQYLPLLESGQAYLAQRGLAPETTKHFRIGQLDTFVSIPIFKDFVLIGIKFRNTVPGLRFYSAKGGKAGLFNYDEVVYQSEPVFILKGEIPVMLLWQMGFLACAPTAGENQKVDDFWPVVSWSRKRIVVGDNDKNPETRAKMQDAARRRAEVLKAEVHFPPDEYKDIDEWILKDKTAVNVLLDWIAE